MFSNSRSLYNILKFANIFYLLDFIGYHGFGFVAIKFVFFAFFSVLRCITVFALVIFGLFKPSSQLLVFSKL